MGRVRRVLVSIFLSTAVLPGTASVDEFSECISTPLPLELLFGGATVAVGVTAALLAVAVSEASTNTSTRSLATIPSVATIICSTGRMLFFIAFVPTVVARLLGKQAQAETFTTIFPGQSG